MPINTKQILADAFYDLCRTNSIRDLKPQDVSNYCGVSRQTFYNYFRDKQEVIEYIWLKRVGNPMEGFNNYTQWSVNCGSELDTNWWFYRKAIRDTDFWRWHQFWLYDQMKQYIAEAHGDAAITEELDETLKMWVIGACATVPEKKKANLSTMCVDLALMHQKNMPALLLEYFPIKQVTMAC